MFVSKYEQKHRHIERVRNMHAQSEQEDRASSLSKNGKYLFA